MTTRQVLNGIAGLPGWAHAIGYIGVPSLIVFFLLGMIPGITSPQEKAFVKQEQIFVNHEAKAAVREERIIKRLTGICYRLPDKINVPACAD